jgi:hypothetical protein
MCAPEWPAGSEAGDTLPHLGAVMFDPSTTPRALLVAAAFLVACHPTDKDTGSDDSLKGDPDAELPVVLTAGMVYTCGMDKAGAVSCWGLPMEPSDGTPEAPYPDTVFKHIDADAGTTCGVRLDGTALCWGGLFEGIEDVDSAAGLATISMGRSHACGLGDDGSITCFGGTGTVPAGSFVDLSVGDLRACAAATDGTVECWGEVGGFFENAPQTGVVQVDVSGLACALDAAGTVTCWDDAHADLGLLTGEVVTSMQTGANFVCGLTPDNRIVCDGDSSGGRLDAPAGTFQHLGLGYDHGCASGPDGLVCWGADDNGQASP